MKSTAKRAPKATLARIWASVRGMSIFTSSEPGEEETSEHEWSPMATVPNPEFHFWRTDARRTSRNIYALISNDVTRPSENDPLVGSMETAAMAEMIVATHNDLVTVYGRHFPKRLSDMVDQIT